MPWFGSIYPMTKSGLDWVPYLCGLKLCAALSLSRTEIFISTSRNVLPIQISWIINRSMVYTGNKLQMEAALEKTVS